MRFVALFNIKLISYKNQLLLRISVDRFLYDEKNISLKLPNPHLGNIALI